MLSAVILNGGKSSRLSVRNKGLLQVGGVPIIKRVYSVLEPFFDEIIVISNDPKDLIGILPLDVMIYTDEIDSKGPLSGIYTGLLKINSNKAFFCPCDMPFLNADLIKYLCAGSLKWDAVCPIVGDSIEPLHSVYKNTCIEYIRELLGQDSPSVLSLFQIVKTRFINVEKIPCKTYTYDFVNINTWEDYAFATSIERQRRNHRE